MAKRKIVDELRSKTEMELSQELLKMKKNLYDIRTKIATHQIGDNNASKVLRRSIARVKTILNEKKRTAGTA